MLLFSLNVIAKPVGLNRAQSVAENFFVSKGFALETKRMSIVMSDPLTKSVTDDAPFFIFNNPSGGYIIVSNEDSVRPILAYSLENSFPPFTNETPQNIKDWLSMIEKQIIYSRQNHAGETVLEEWKKWEDVKKYSNTQQSGKVISKLETALWNQGVPFNQYCPIINGEVAVTGCLPTAMAILMRYYKYPSTAPGCDLPLYYYSPSYGFTWGERATEEEITQYGLLPNGGYRVDYAYDWSNMPLSNGDDFSETQKSAVARLMIDCGTITQACYGQSTGAAHINTLKLVDYMGYDKSAKYIEQSWYSQPEWIRILEKEISEGRPVLMAGFDYYSGGHAFIADGFDSDDYLSFNWGWGGYCNGFYAMDAFGFAEEQRVPSYFFTQTAIVNLKPDEGGEWDYEVFYHGNRRSCMSIVENECKVGKIFHIHFPLMFGDMRRRIPVSSEGILAHLDREGSIKEYISSPFNLFNDNDIECILEKTIDYGDILAVFYRVSHSAEWSPVRYVRQENSGVIRLREELSMQEASSLRVVNIEQEVEYGALKKKSKLLQIRTKIGSYLQIFDSANELICDGTGEGIIPFLFWYVSNGFYGEHIDNYGYEYTYINIYISELPQGDYRFVFSRSGGYESAEIIIKR